MFLSFKHFFSPACTLLRLCFSNESILDTIRHTRALTVSAPKQTKGNSSRGHPSVGAIMRV